MRRILRALTFSTALVVGCFALCQPAFADYGDEFDKKKTSKTQRLAIIGLVAFVALGGSAFVGLNMWERYVQRRKLNQELMEKAERGVL
jgi:hypothetical protein